MNNAEAVNWLINITADIGKTEHQDLWHYEQALSEIREMLEDTPIIEPEPHWIPAIVPPDSDRRVLCLTKTKKGVLNYVLGYYAHDRKYWVCGMNSNVIAWMDLPDPPEEEQT